MIETSGEDEQGRCHERMGTRDWMTGRARGGHTELSQDRSVGGEELGGDGTTGSRSSVW